MAFFGANLHAMLASISAHARELGSSEAESRINSVIEFFESEGFQHQECVRRAGLKWETLEKSFVESIKPVSQRDMNIEKEGYIRVMYLGIVTYAKPIMAQGDIEHPDTTCLFEIHGSNQRVPIPVQFVILQDRERLKNILLIEGQSA